jgi:hypothetical protein
MCELEMRVRRACNRLRSVGKPYHASDVWLLWCRWSFVRHNWF